MTYEIRLTQGSAYKIDAQDDASAWAMAERALLGSGHKIELRKHGRLLGSCELPVRRNPAPRAVTDILMSFKIDDPNAFTILGLIEGQKWRAEQQADQLSPTTFTANLDAFEVLRDMGAEAQGLRIEDILDGGGVIVGSEQPSRRRKYRVDPDGSITMIEFAPYEIFTEVHNLRTGQSAVYNLPPERAVVAAHQQLDLHNQNTWEYDWKQAQHSGSTWADGDWAARDDVVPSGALVVESVATGKATVMDPPRFAPTAPEAPSPAKPKAGKKPTFGEARAAILARLRADGWTVKTDLKVPHATSPDGQTRLWFKPESVYANDKGAGIGDIGGAHSLVSDTRAYVSGTNADAFMRAVERHVA